MAAETPRQYVPLTCHGHSRPVPHISFSLLEKEETYYLLSACKDGNPMLRDGVTGDWIGTFIGHKGAVWQARLSPDASYAATASADFTAKIWDTHTGVLLFTLQHDHIVRAIAYPPDNSDLVATGGMEKKLRVFDLSEIAASNPGGPITIPAAAGFEIGEGVHQGSIKFICWTNDPNVLVTASDNTIRWFDLPTRSVIHQEVLDGEIRSCEMVSVSPEYAAETDIGGGLPVLAVSAGKTAYFWGGRRAFEHLKHIVLPYTIASVALDVKGRKLVVGEEPGTWVKVISYDDEVELDVHKGHHGPVWSIAFSPDGKLYATGSEDGTIKMWKNCEGFYGLWRGGNERTAEQRDAERSFTASSEAARSASRRSFTSMSSMGSEDVSFSAPSSENSNPKKRSYSYGDSQDTPTIAKDRPIAKGKSLGLNSNSTFIFGSGIDPNRPFTFLPKDRS